MGATGQVGRELMEADWAPNFELIGAHRPSFDITNAQHVEGAVLDGKPDVVINAAAYTAVDRAESDEATAFAVNEHGPLLLATACARQGVPIIHISTDYVFDGTGEKPYGEGDPIAPANAYGRSKAAGEAAVRLLHSQHVILRTSWVYASHGQNFVRTMLRLAAEHQDISVVADQIGTPTSAVAIAATLVQIAQRVTTKGDDPQSAWGTYHFTAGGETSWHGFAEHIFCSLERRGLKRPRLKAIPTADYPTPASRPANSRLDCSLIERTFGIHRNPWGEDVDRALDILLAQKAATKDSFVGSSV